MRMILICVKVQPLEKPRKKMISQKILISDEQHSSVIKLIPFAAMMLAGSLTVNAQDKSQASEQEKTLQTVVVKDALESQTKAKDNILVKKTGIAKGQQDLRDIPQTVTVMTEKLMDDRNLDDFREVMKITAGVTFQAGETGEEDVRMRGFSLAQAGDIYVDGMRDVSMTERDMFNVDRVEVLKGSASMLFGKGSTGGVVNQVSKQAFLMDQSEVNLTLGSGNLKRLTGDFNFQTGSDAALRLNVMSHQADNWGAKVDKKGAALNYRWSIGFGDEYSVSLYHLESNSRPLYNHPWILSASTGPANLIPVLPANNFYGLSSDYLETDTTHASFSHTHRFDSNIELKTTLRHGQYERNLLGTQIGWMVGTTLESINDATVLRRNAPKSRHGKSDITQLQSDFVSSFTGMGYKQNLVAGFDYLDEAAKRNNAATAGLPAYAALTTKVGTPNDGASVNTNRAIPMNQFQAHTTGVYAQNTVHLNEEFKVIGGLRLDRFEAVYSDTNDRQFNMAESLYSPRLGAIWQPNDGASYYASYGTSYNTSADTYQYAINLGLTGSQVTLANTPPEKSRNFEVGAKFDVFEKKGLLGVSVFHSEKYNERNTDVDSVANQFLLSGKRHANGLELNFAGRLSPKWEVFYNHTFIPDASIDESSQKLSSSGTGAQVKGDRPGLTPQHSASLWSTYVIAPQWRIGGGLNYRSEQNPDGQRIYTAKAFTTVDVMAERTMNDSTLVKFNISNLTNLLYVDQLYRGFYIPGVGRRVEISLKKMF